jgi:hypothetical protein
MTGRRIAAGTTNGSSRTALSQFMGFLSGSATRPGAAVPAPARGRFLPEHQDSVSAMITTLCVLCTAIPMSALR